MTEFGGGPNEEDSDDEEAQRCRSLVDRARELARAGRIPEALEAVRAVPIPRGFSGWAHGRTGVLIDIASKLVEGGARAEATRVLEEARQSCAAIQEGTVWEAADGFHRIARLLAAVGARDEAVETWLQAARLARAWSQWDHDCVQIMARVAQDLALIGERERATEVVRQMRPGATRDRARWFVAEEARGASPPAWIRQHYWDEREQFRMETEEEGQYRRLAGQAYSLAKAGGAGEAHQRLRQLPTPRGFRGWAWEKARALLAIASALAEEGAGPGAVTVLREARVTCAAMQDGALWEAAECFDQIAQLLAKVGAREEALATWAAAARQAQQCQHEDFDCMRLLARVAQHLAEIGETDRATEVAGWIELDAIRERALWYIAEHARGRTPPAHIWPD